MFIVKRCSNKVKKMTPVFLSRSNMYGSNSLTLPVIRKEESTNTWTSKWTPMNTPGPDQLVTQPTLHFGNSTCDLGASSL